MKVPEPRKLKSGTWFIQMRLNGVSVPVSAPTAKECRDTAQLIKAEHRAGRRAVGGKSDLTMRQAIDKYIKAKQNSLSPSTVRGYRTIQRNYFKAYMDVPLKNISNWQAVYDSEEGHLASKTRNNAFSLLSSAVEHSTVQKRPKIDKVPTVTKPREFLDYQEILSFVETIKGKPWEAEALLALHSLRASELLDLTWEDIDFNKGIIRVRGATVPDENEKFVHKDTNKTEESTRSVPIFIPRLLELLKQRKSAGQRIRYYKRTRNLSEAIKTVCKENKLPEVTLHGLRHSFASLCLHLKIPEDVTMRLGGWSDYMTVHKIYTHISKRDMRQHTVDLQDFFKNANENANDV